MAAWETDLLNKTRTWSPEGMALFGLDLKGRRGTVGGENDEYLRALHPDDRHLMKQFHDIAQKQDSFAAEYRIIKSDGSVRWVSGRGLVVERGPSGEALRMISIVADITERKEAEEHVAYLLREMSHRAKNLISVIQAIAHRTLKNSASFDEFEQRFSGRLQALARSHDVLANQSWQVGSLEDLARTQLSSFVSTDTERVAISGPYVELDADAAQAIGLAVHELATNAAKYGSLSVAEGRVALLWTIVEDTLHLSWTESDGPQITSPSRKGFGHIVSNEMISRSIGAVVTSSFPASGVVWKMSVPVNNLTRHKSLSAQ
jgi:PAS domain S-box-containing protein